MSPEQLRGIREIGPPADLFAVGVVLYRMLTGSMPFRAKSREELLKKILAHDVTPMTEHRMDIPKSVTAVVMKALHPDPRQRFATAADFTDALAHCERMRSAEILVGSPSQDEKNAQLALRQTAPQTPSAKGAVPTPTFDPFEVKVGEQFRITKPVMTPGVPGLPPVNDSNLAYSKLPIKADEESVPTLETYTTESGAVDAHEPKPSLRLVTPLSAEANMGVDPSRSASQKTPLPAAETSMSNLPTESAPVSKLAYADSVQSQDVEMRSVSAPPVAKQRRAWLGPFLVTGVLLSILAGGFIYGGDVLDSFDKDPRDKVLGVEKDSNTVTDMLDVPKQATPPKQAEDKNDFKIPVNETVPEKKPTETSPNTVTQQPVETQTVQIKAADERPSLPRVGDTVEQGLEPANNQAGLKNTDTPSGNRPSETQSPVAEKNTKNTKSVKVRKNQRKKTRGNASSPVKVDNKPKVDVPKEDDDDIIEESPY